MPLFYQHTINAESRLGVWKIEEGEAFFLEKVPVHRNISHPHKRLQHLAGRYLLQYLFPEFPYSLIRIADTRKPFLPDEAFHFSISHCTDYAAAIVSRRQRVGIDIEEIRPLVGRITHKFLSEEEQAALHLQPPVEAESDPADNATLLQRLTLCWTAKEAMFKWHGHGALDFKKHMKVDDIHTNFTGAMAGNLSCRFSFDDPVLLNLPFRLWNQVALAWLIT